MMRAIIDYKFERALKVGHIHFMQVFMKIMKKFVLFLLVFVAAWALISNWSFIFKKRVVGEVSTVESTDKAFAVIANSRNPLNPQIFSYSIAIKDLHSGEIHMASSEDRKWGAVEKGNCVVAAYFPYPPWKLDKGTTDYNARLLRNFQSCETVEKNETLGFIGNLKFFFMIE